MEVEAEAEYTLRKELTTFANGLDLQNKGKFLACIMGRMKIILYCFGNNKEASLRGKNKNFLFVRLV